MNILMIAYNVDISSRTGDAIHVRELVSNIASLGNKVSLVVRFNSDLKEDISSLTNNPNVNLKYVKNPKINYPRSKDISMLFQCLSLAKKNHYDIIYERNFSCRIGVILSKILKLPLVVEINGLVDEEAEMLGRHVSPIRKMVGKRLRRLFFIQTRKIVVVTDGIKEELVNSYQIPSEKIVVVANGANTNLFRPMDQKEVKAELDLDEKYNYICFVGNLAPWQGVEYLIRAAPMILKKVPDTRFLIVGDGIMMDEWKRMTNDFNLREYFLFTGAVTFELVPKYINASDICVAPFVRARNEKIGLSPLKIYEYMACGKSVIASDIKGVVDLLEISKGGITVSSDKSTEFTDAIVTLIQNENLMVQMGMNGREYVIKNHSWAIVAKNVVNVYENVVQKS